MRLTHCFSALAIAAAVLTTPALADDPKDPAMQSAEARARDREIIRQLNLDMLAQVTERDRRNAKSNRDYRLARQGRHPDQLAYQARLAEYERDRARHDDSQAQYQRAMEAWRRDVAACRAGDYRACDRR